MNKYELTAAKDAYREMCVEYAQQGIYAPDMLTLAGQHELSAAYLATQTPLQLDDIFCGLGSMNIAAFMRRPHGDPEAARRFSFDVCLLLEKEIGADLERAHDAIHAPPYESDAEAMADLDMERRG